MHISAECDEDDDDDDDCVDWVKRGNRRRDKGYKKGKEYYSKKTRGKRYADGYNVR
jgi:hypothetical protein